MIQTGNTPPSVYTNYFEFVRAQGAEALAEAFRIRYQVYCEERGFLPPGKYPDHLERDPYDETSIHLLSRHRFNHRAAGTMRLIMPSPRGFPVQQHCVFDPSHLYCGEPGHPALERYIEVSRLAVAKTFRQRADDTVYGGPPRAGGAALPQEAGPEVVAGLYKLLYHETKRRGLTHWLVAMERSLQLLLKRIGYQFVPIGPVADYYGPVTPFILKIEDMERYFYQRRRAILNYWVEGLEPEYAPAFLLTPKTPVGTAPMAVAGGTPGQR